MTVRHMAVVRHSAREASGSCRILGLSLLLTIRLAEQVCLFRSVVCCLVRDAMNDEIVSKKIYFESCSRPFRVSDDFKRQGVSNGIINLHVFGRCRRIFYKNREIRLESIIPF